MMKFPYGICDFYQIVTENYFYVDRTDRIRMIEEAGKQLLFLRPRRFGKSLLVSTLQAIEELKIFFANVPYDLHLKNEIYYQSIFFAIFQLLGFNIEAEIKTNRGRIDVVVDLPEMIYLFEFKLFGSIEISG